MRPPKFCLSRSIYRRVMAFRILSNNDRPPTFNIWSWLSLLSEFVVVYEISSKLVHAFGPSLLNVQSAVARQRPLPWQPHFGGHVGNVMGCDSIEKLGHTPTFPSFSHTITGSISLPRDNAVWHSVSFMKNYTLLINATSYRFCRGT